MQLVECVFTPSPLHRKKNCNHSKGLQFYINKQNLHDKLCLLETNDLDSQEWARF